MEKVDAKKEIDTLLSHCTDVEHFIGVAMVQDSRGTPTRFAYARVLFKEDGPLADWPEKLVYRRAVEAGSGVQMFAICAPGAFLHPLVLTEWEDTYQTFVDAADTLKMFAVELVTPKRKRIALVVDDKVKDTSEHEITPEDYDYLCNKAFSSPPDSVEPS